MQQPIHPTYSSASAPVIEKPLSDRWFWVVAGVLSVLMAILAIFLFSLRNTDPDPIARALPIVPGLLTEPLSPLTLEELSGDTLPLEITGIRDRAVVDAPAIAFWGDTAPDAFVTVNGVPVEVSKYGAFVVDIPLEDGANFIEVLASDFQGRTTSRSFTLVRTQ